MSIRRNESPVSYSPSDLLRMMSLSFLGTNLAQVGYYELGLRHARAKAY